MITEMTEEQTFFDAVQRSLATHGGRTALTFLVEGELEEPDTSTFAELDRAARTVAADLQACGVAPGERVMLLEAPSREFVVAFLGCIYSGTIAVPAYPPSPFLGSRGNERLRTMLQDATATAVLTTSRRVPVLEFLNDTFPELSWVFVDKPANSADAYSPVDVAAEDVAFLQYTSGSTSAPRGVRVTHGALLANIGMMIEPFELNEDSVACSWLPPFHDMGLISMILAPLVLGFQTVQMAPEAFLRRPERWLKAWTRYGATWTAAPNFAYDLCIRRISDLDGLDLSNMTGAVNGAEPVRERTMAEFARKFARCGLRPDGLWVGYGCAEATLMTNIRRRGPGSTIWIDSEELGRGRLVTTDPELGQPLVSCGPPVPGTTTTIRDPETEAPVQDGSVGEIWSSGPQVCDGYWDNPEATSRVFPGGVVRTGDLGVLWEGELYVTGRIKDLLIVRGRNHYPQDIEQTMEAADPNLREGCGVAVAVPTETGELLVLIQEVVRKPDGDPEQIAENIRREVIQQHAVAPDAIVLVKPGGVQKTTSGKLRRASTAEAFRNGTLRTVHQWAAPGRL